MTKKKVLLIIVVFLGLFLIANSSTFQDKVFEMVLKRRVTPPRNYLGNNRNLDIIFCGSGSPFPDYTFKRGQACLAILAKGHFFLFDTGSGSADKIAIYQLPTRRLSQVFFSHLHSDHIAGLGEVRLQSWIQGKNEPLKVSGPKGTLRTVKGFYEAYFRDSGFRIAHHGTEYLDPKGPTYTPQDITLGPGQESKVVFEEDNLKITVFLVKHAPIEPAFGYRIDFGDRSVTYSGDTVKHKNIARFGKNTDVLIHEALNGDMVKLIAKRLKEISRVRLSKIIHDILDYHASPSEAAESANEAGASLLALNHIVPPLPNRIAESIFLRKAKKVIKKDLLIAYDGLHIRLPLGTKEIIKDDLRP
ncbi:MBL fold metallo-hydrolase [Bacteriovoracales bacterium]|nr:MBL fold metallo-hydrolase [Bacteriovoracales bacterium]